MFTDAISVKPFRPGHGLPDGGMTPDVYAEFIPERDGSAVPNVDVMRGAAAVGDPIRLRFEDVGAPQILSAGADFE
jgi:hypothetical protein